MFLERREQILTADARKEDGDPHFLYLVEVDGRQVGVILPWYGPVVFDDDVDELDPTSPG